ncbi:hypothetical protein CBS115989_480 [Aspergillus niger]|nr:hypothetical protein CBS115989_480 [Aspergillus niger]KAI2828147.1 hypothetical protein CBS133816_5701 [Aspergillus niger]KAI2850831.1 hypothetical protein CBS11350_1423 [Aspergillus niger]KAI2860549.1 hypothetical protein CBS11232_1399 [Aspergillus niger]KAI2867616.1 hypothetical protein CBS12448_62 [Aspergillus niger]
MCNPRVLKLGNLSRSKCEFILSKCSSASLVGRHAEIATGFKPVLTSPPADRNLESPVFPICSIPRGAAQRGLHLFYRSQSDTESHALCPFQQSGS